MHEYILVTFIIVGFVFSLFRRMRIWNKGGDSYEPLRWSLLLAIPKRYFVDLHHIVMRDKYIANTHIFVAGGVILTTLLLFLFALGLNISVLDFILGLSLVSIFIGVVLLSYRRIFKAEKRLSKGAFSFIPLSLLAYCAGIFLLLISNENQVYSKTIGLLLALVGVGEIFFGGALDRPLKHIISGSLHLAFHPRQDRFQGQISANLRSDIARNVKEGKVGDETENATQGVGVGKPEQFSWNQILGFDACIECGKCERACPAFAAEQPLNPKKFIQDLLRGSQGKSDSDYKGSPTPSLAVGKHSGAPDKEMVSSLVENDTLYSCTTCRACVYECPMMIEHVDAIVDMRRFQVLNKGALSEGASLAMDNLRYSETVSGNDCKERLTFTGDLNIPFAEEGTHYDCLLMVGESGFELRNQDTVRKYASMIRESGKTVAFLKNEPDTGDLARRLGDEVLFVQMAKRLTGMMKTLSFDCIITHDPHIFNILKNEYQDFGLDVEVYHHSEYLLKLINENVLKVATLDDLPITYHDPCYLGRYNGIVEAPRELLNKVGIKVQEMQRSKYTSRCCGWGGGSAFSDVGGKRRIPDMRMEDVQKTQVSKVAVACPNCATMLEGVPDSNCEVVDVVDFVLKANTLAKIQAVDSQNA